MTQDIFLALLLAGWIVSIEIRIWVTGKTINLLKNILEMLADVSRRKP